MAEGRGKKAKKAKWQLVLGLKQVLCGALGLTWMMVIIFILGVLAGRGDIYRWLSSWGLISPVPVNIAQWTPPPPAPPAAAPVKSFPPAPGAKSVASKTSTSAPPPRPVTGSIAHPPSHKAAPKAKKVKKESSSRSQKTREEELRRLRREVAAKLRFQNSFDSRRSRTTQPTKKKAKAAQGQKAPSRQVRVAQFRSLKAAKARMADLRKKGQKVSLKKGKDRKGSYYEIYREAPVKQAKQVRGNVGLAQKTKKSTGKKPKPQVRVRN